MDGDTTRGIGSMAYRSVNAKDYARLAVDATYDTSFIKGDDTYETGLTTGTIHTKVGSSTNQSKTDGVKLFYGTKDETGVVDRTSNMLNINADGTKITKDANTVQVTSSGTVFKNTAVVNKKERDDSTTIDGQTITLAPGKTAPTAKNVVNSDGMTIVTSGSPASMASYTGTEMSIKSGQNKVSVNNIAVRFEAYADDTQKTRTGRAYMNAKGLTAEDEVNKTSIKANVGKTADVVVTEGDTTWSLKDAATKANAAAEAAANAVRYDTNSETSTVTFNAGSEATTLKNVADVVLNVKGKDYSFVKAGVIPGTIGNPKVKYSMALGEGSTVAGTNSIAIGYKSEAKGSADFGNSTAIGSTSFADLSGTALGYYSQALGGSSTALGTYSKANENAVAIGKDANALGADSVALGRGSYTLETETGVVSVGSSDASTGFTRKIINVTDGTIAENSKEVVNGGQLYNVQQSISAMTDGAVTYDKTDTGALDKSSVTFNPNGTATTLKNVADVVLNINGKNYSFIGAGVVPGMTSTGQPVKNTSLSLGKTSIVDGEKGTAIGYHSIAKNGNSTAIGYSSSAVMNATALGSGASAGFAHSIAIGVNSKTSTDANIAIGTESEASGEEAVTIGQMSSVKGNSSVALGYKSKVFSGEDHVVSFGVSGKDGFTRRLINVSAGSADTDAVNVKQLKDAISNVAGSDVKWDSTEKDSLNGVGLKDGAVTADKGISAGNGAFKVTENGNVTVGDNKFTVDAASGNTHIGGNLNVEGTLTVGGKQLATSEDISGVQGSIDTVKKTLGSGTFTNQAGTYTDAINQNTAGIKANTEAIAAVNKTIGGSGENGALTLDNGESTIEAGINNNTQAIQKQATTIEQNSQAIGILGNTVNKLDNRIDKVGAGAAALAALHPLDYDPANKWDFAAGYGHYQGANAVAIGTYYRPSENTMISLGGSFGGGENMVNAGVSFKVGDGSTSTSRTAMATKINALETHNKALEDRVAAQDETIKEMQAQIQQLLKAQQPAK